MKTVTCLILMFVCCCAAQHAGFPSQSPIQWRRLTYWQRTWKTSPTPVDRYEPCPNRDDECIRGYLCRISQCRPVTGEVDKVVRRDYETATYIPNMNFTALMLNSTLSGFGDNVVQDFYINRRTQRLVYTVVFRELRVDAENCYYIFHRRSQEPKIYEDEVQVKWRSLILSAVIPILDGELSLKDALINLHPGGNTTYRTGHTISTTPDKVVRETLELFPGNMDVAAADSAVSQSSSYFLSYLQNFICDFGFPDAGFLMEPN